MIVNVAAIASIQSKRNIAPTEVHTLLKPFVGKTTAPDVQDNLKVADFINVLVTQLDLTGVGASYNVEKNGKALDKAKTLQQNGVKANDSVKLRVILQVV